VRIPEFRIGTAKDCHLRCASLVISPHHCTILLEPDRIVVRDEGSRLGTYLNGRRINAAACMFHGDRLRVGHLEFQVVIGARPSPRDARRRPTKREDDSGRETVHKATDTIVELVSRIKQTERGKRPDNKHASSTPAQPAVTQESRESGALPQS
jgi:pSer/pThr/pTyr-binding forkhead associated (FHA) protein